MCAGLLCLALAGCTSGAPGDTTAAPEGTASSATSPASPPGPPAPPGGSLTPAPELARALEQGPAPATSPRRVAAQLLAAERAIADPRTRPAVLDAAGRLQQLAYRVLGEHPRWDSDVLQRLPRSLHRTVTDNVAALRALRSMHPTRPGALADELPAWRIVRPAPREVLMRSYRQAQRAFGVPWEYLAAINLVETALGRIRGMSVAGAQGPMQFMPATWAAYGRGDVHDPHDAILGAARYLAAMGFADDPGRALLHYNNHPAYVRAITLLAGVMERHPRAFAGYHSWQVYYLTSRGGILLPVGYAARRPVPVDHWLARHRGD